MRAPNAGERAGAADVEARAVERDLLPVEDAVLVEQLERARMERVLTARDGGPELLQPGDVLVELLLRERGSVVRAVLLDAGAAQLHAVAVQDQQPVLGDPDRADAVVGVVVGAPAPRRRDPDAVEVRAARLPEPRVREPDGAGHALRAAARHLHGPEPDSLAADAAVDVHGLLSAVVVEDGRGDDDLRSAARAPEDRLGVELRDVDPVDAAQVDL